MFENSDQIDFTPELLWTKVFAFLRDAIIQEKIKPGEKLNVAFIASKLGLSRSPIREAIRILEAHNFVETIPQKGAYVKQITAEEVVDLYVVLRSLLSAAVQLATENLDVEKRKELKKIVRELKRVKLSMDIDEITEASRRFHNFVISSCGNRLLFKIHESILVYRERPYLLAKQMQAEDLAAIAEEPIVISIAMLNGDPVEAGRLMEKHMRNAGARTLNALSNAK